MKFLSKTMWAVSALSMLLLAGSCKKDPVDPVEPPDPPVDPEKKEIVVTGKHSVPAEAAADPEILRFVWNEGDRISIFYEPEGYDEGKLVNAEFLLAAADAGKAEGSFTSSSKPVWNNDAAGHKFFAVYPYNAGNSDKASVKVNIPTLLSPSAEDPFAGAFMTASASSDKIAENMAMEFTSPLLFVKLVIDASGSVINGEELESVVFGSAFGISGNATYNMLTGAMSDFDSGEVTFNYEGGAVIDNVMELCFAVNPGADLSAGNSNVTVDITGAIFTATIDVDVAASLVAGKLNTIEVNVQEAVDNGNAVIEIEQNIVTDLANSYILEPGGRITFPVKQAYNAWAGYIGEPVADGVKLTCELLWMDTPGGFSNASAISSVAMHNASGGIDAGISVKAGSAEGNAVVALMADGTIIWSWHIWVTGYDPSAAAGQNVVGGYTLMDRNIGALNKTPGDRDSFGLAYQWGRKDPFPGSDGSRQGTWIELSDYREIWNGAGELLTVGENGTGISIGIPPFSDEIDGIAYATNNPSKYIKGLGPTYYVFWTSNSTMLNPGTLKADLWGGSTSGTQGAKSVFDPCPAGWRVAHSPEIAVALGEKGGTIGVAEGMDFGECGYFPFSGIINADGINGGLWHQVTMGSAVWLDWPGGFGGRAIEFVESTGMGGPTSSIFRSYGCNVRCEKES